MIQRSAGYGMQRVVLWVRGETYAAGTSASGMKEGYSERGVNGYPRNGSWTPPRVRAGRCLARHNEAE